MVVSNDAVTLSGTVGDRGTKRYAELLAERISGVRNVQNKLQVNQGSTASSQAALAG